MSPLELTRVYTAAAHVPASQLEGVTVAEPPPFVKATVSTYVVVVVVPLLVDVVVSESVEPSKWYVQADVAHTLTAPWWRINPQVPSASKNHVSVADPPGMGVDHSPTMDADDEDDDEHAAAATARKAAVSSARTMAAG